MTDTLPDLLRPGLDLVFAGLNPAERSASLGHYYAHPNNDFWTMLSASPLVDSEVGPDDDGDLPDRFGIGLTDVVKRVVTDSGEVSKAELRDAVPAFERRIADAAPRAVCFNGAKVFDALYPGARAPRTWGRQRRDIGGAEIWVMPSTSGSTRG